MEVQQLLQTKKNYRDMLENAILEFVRENGEDLDDFFVNEFGLDEGREGEEHITKVWDFFNYGGCYYIETPINHELDIDCKEDADEIREDLDDVFGFSAFQCLYIVNEDGKERLKYYRFSNSGTHFDDDNAEPDHDYVSKLSLEDLSLIIEGIRLSNEERV